MDPELKQYLKERFNAIDGRFDAIDGRFERVDGYLGEFKREMIAQFDSIDRRLDLLASTVSAIAAQLSDFAGPAPQSPGAKE